jgi:hypothetical protein
VLRGGLILEWDGKGKSWRVKSDEWKVESQKGGGRQRAKWETVKGEAVKNGSLRDPGSPWMVVKFYNPSGRIPRYG